MTNGQAYFAQTQSGESQWWRWLMGFWFIILAWLLGQLIFTSPIAGIAADIDPDLNDRLNQAVLGDLDSQILSLGLSMLGFGAAVFIGIIAFIINRNSKNMLQAVAGWITGICVILSIACLVQLIKLGNSPDSNAIFLEMIAISPINYALLLLTFSTIMAGTILVQTQLHHRPIVSLLTAASKFNWKRVGFAFGLTWAVYGISCFIGHISGLAPLEYSFDATRFAGFAIASFLFIPVQSASEELVFRGYLNQGLGHFISNKWIVFIITSAMFASMHLANPEAASAADEGMMIHLLTMSGYFLFGLILSLIVYSEGGLEAVIGIHIANNLFAAVFVNYEGSVLPTPSFFLATPNASIDTPIVVIGLAVIYYVLRQTRPKLQPDQS